jgi:mannobiose 2-epimerase
MIYSFSLGYRLTGRATYLEHAAQGVEFFRRHFWDERHGGWFRTTSRQGEPIDEHKWPYGIAFAVYALADYARAGGDRAALDLAVETYELHRRHGWDQGRGGVYWNLARDWSPVDPTKRIDSMLHTMEGASSLLAATGDERYLRDLGELCDTIMSRTYDQRNGCTREWFTPDWQEATERSRGLVNYGHIAEAAWFVASVAAFTGERRPADFARSLLGYVMRRGWDRQHGGIYSLGHADGAVLDPGKTWWMQAEMLGALSLAYRLTGDALYRDWLREQATFVHRRQRDRRDGEWYSSVYADGTIRDGRKGSPSKAAYHVAQGLHHAARNLALGEASRSTGGWEDFAL